MAETAIVKKEMSMGDHGVQLRTMEDAYRFAVAVVKSGMVPRGMDTPEKCLIAIQTGMEAGLTPMQALRSVVVINGTPSWKGDAALALIRNSGRLASFAEGKTGEGDALAHWIETKRVNSLTTDRTMFSVADAKRAGLWGKQGPWTQYPNRMLRYRALGFHARDYFGDVLAGIAIEEEVRDYPPEAHPAASTTVTALPAPDPLLAQVDELDAPQDQQTSPAAKESPTMVGEGVEAVNPDDIAF